MRIGWRLFLLCTLFLAACSGGHLPKYRIGVDPSWYPLDLRGREKNVLAFSTDLLREIAALKHIRIDLVTRNWDNLVQGLREAKYDAILASIPPYNFIQKTFDFSSLYLPTGPVLVVPFNSDIHSLEMLKGKEIAVIQGAATTPLLEKVPDILIRSYESIPQALNAIVDETVDAAFINILPATAYCLDLYQGQLKIATSPLNQDGLRLITEQGKADSLIKDFNNGLKELQEKGKVKALMQKWSL